MLEALPLLAVTLVFIGIFAYSYATIQLEEIRADWDARRCDPLVMAMAHMVPDKNDPSIDPSDFSSDNFSFCIGRIIDSSISIFLQPVMALFAQQMEATKPINNSMNYLRTMASSLMAPLLAVFGKLWEKFGVILYQAGRIFFKLFSAMDRIFGIATASVFAGMSMYKAIQNSIGFVIQVIIAILAILCVLVVFLFFVMWPVIPIILTMIGILSTTVYAANVSGMRDSFCVGPNTLVKTSEGWKKVSDIECGDVLAGGGEMAGGGEVEGVLKVKCGSGGECVSIRGVIISKTHLVLCEGEWIPAEKHYEALPLGVTTPPDFLYCLNTTTRTWEVKCGEGEEAEPFTIRDWEELPEDHEEIDFAWETLIYRLLNGKDADVKPLRQAAGRGLFGKRTYVWKDMVGTNVPIDQVRIGDMIGDGKGLTRVIGIYKDTSSDIPQSGPNESVWYYMPIKKQWNHPAVPRKTKEFSQREGYQLVTESGTFMVGYQLQPNSMKHGRMLVRDFTEVGAARIHETYPFTQSVLNN
jgi:hypothetical protein